MQDPADPVEASIPTENGRIDRRMRMSGIMRRDAATRTMPIPSASSEQHPASPPPTPPSPPPAPPLTLPSLQDEDLPAAKGHDHFYIFRFRHRFRYNIDKRSFTKDY
jgi:hypothetical protein